MGSGNRGRSPKRTRSQATPAMSRSRSSVATTSRGPSSTGRGGPSGPATYWCRAIPPTTSRVISRTTSLLRRSSRTCRMGGGTRTTARGERRTWPHLRGRANRPFRGRPERHEQEVPGQPVLPNSPPDAHHRRGAGLGGPFCPRMGTVEPGRATPPRRRRVAGAPRASP